MSTGFTLPTTITKRTKILNTGIVSNDVIYTCPANCVTDVYLSDLSHGNVSGVFFLTSIVLVRAGGPVPATLGLASSQNVIGASNFPLVLNNNGSFSPPPNALSNAVVGSEVGVQSGSGSTGASEKFGSVVRLFPNDYLVANYNGATSTCTLAYSTIETFGS